MRTVAKRAWQRKFLPRKLAYYNNSVAHYGVLLLIAGDIERNPGDNRAKCPECERIIAVNHRAVCCSTCDNKYHIKCGNITPKMYNNMALTTTVLWNCNLCLPNVLPFVSLGDNSLVELFDDHDQPTDIYKSSHVSSSTESMIDNAGSMEWYKDNIRSNFKFSLSFAHLNVNALVNKIDEIKLILSTNALLIFYSSRKPNCAIQSVTHLLNILITVPFRVTEQEMV